MTLLLLTLLPMLLAVAPILTVLVRDERPRAGATATEPLLARLGPARKRRSGRVPELEAEGGRSLARPA